MAPEPKETDSARTIIVRLSIETHKALRIKVAEEDTSIQQWVQALIERQLGTGETPSKGASSKSGRK